MLISLPFPNPKLNPNRAHGKHWSTTSTLKKSAKEHAYFATKASLGAWKPHSDDIALKVTFVMPDKRRRDLTNLSDASKLSYDGIALALGVDDKQFNPITLTRGYDKNNSRMEVEIE